MFGLNRFLERPHFAKDEQGTLVFYPNSYWREFFTKGIVAYVVASEGEYQRLRRLVKRLRLWSLLLLGTLVYLAQSIDLRILIVPFWLLLHFSRKTAVRRLTSPMERYRFKPTEADLLHAARPGRRFRLGPVRIFGLSVAPFVLAWLQFSWMPRYNWRNHRAEPYLVITAPLAIAATTILLMLLYERLLGAYRFQAWKLKPSVFCAVNVLLAVSAWIWGFLFYLRFKAWLFAAFT